MKKIMIISLISGTCLLLLKCKKNDNNLKTNNHVYYSYELKLEFKDESWPAGRFDWILTDKAILNIDVKDSIVSSSNIENEDGLVSPATQFFENGIESCTATWQKGESLPGYINITGVSGKIVGGPGEKVLLTLSITSTNAKTPKFTEVWTKSGTYVTGGENLMPLSYFYIFNLNKETKTKTSTLLTATLTPI